MVAGASVAEPWFIGDVFGLFLLGAASTKDFSDMEGDRAGGCRTLPIAFGVRKAAYMIAPSSSSPGCSCRSAHTSASSPATASPSTSSASSWPSGASIRCGSSSGIPTS